MATDIKSIQDNFIKKFEIITDCNNIFTDVPFWANNVAFKENMNENKNHTHYRIVLIKYSENIYYLKKKLNYNI